MTFTMFTFARPKVQHPAFFQIVRPKWPSLLNDTDRYVADGLARFGGTDPLAVPWLLQNAGHDYGIYDTPFLQADPDYWRAWIDRLLGSIERLAGGIPMGLSFDLERLSDAHGEGRYFGKPTDTIEVRAIKREQIINKVWYQPIKEWGGEHILTGNYWGFTTPGIEDQPVLYRPHSVSSTVTELDRPMAGGREVLPWVHTVGNKTPGGPDVSPGNFMFPVSASHAQWGSTRFFLWCGEDQTEENWQLTADALPTIGIVPPERLPNAGTIDDQIREIVALYDAGEITIQEMRQMIADLLA